MTPRAAPAVLEFDESALDGSGHGMGPVIGSQLRQNMRDVVLDGFLRYQQPGGDLFIAVAGRYQPQNLDFAVAEVVFGGMVGQFRGNLRGMRFCPRCTARMISRSSVFTRPFKR